MYKFKHSVLLSLKEVNKTNRFSACRLAYDLVMNLRAPCCRMCSGVFFNNDHKAFWAKL